jgi:hypothetical protein
MTHPFRLAGTGAALIHNGTLRGPLSEDATRPHYSDTALLAERAANWTADDWAREYAAKDAADYYGWSRIAALYPDGSIVRHGPQNAWIADGGCYYSNGSYRARAERWEADPRLWLSGNVPGGISDTARRLPALPAHKPGRTFVGPASPTAASLRDIYARTRTAGPVREYRIDPTSGLLELVVKGGKP